MVNIFEPDTWVLVLITNLEIVYIFIAITVLADKIKMLPLKHAPLRSRNVKFQVEVMIRNLVA